MKKTYTHFSDPGHGWVKVSRKELIDLGILNKISSLSYQRGEYVFLEEDCDASHFVSAYQAKHGKKPSIPNSHTNNQSKIRNYETFNVNTMPATKKTLAQGLKVRIFGNIYELVKKSNVRGSWVVINEAGSQFRARTNSMELI